MAQSSARGDVLKSESAVQRELGERLDVRRSIEELGEPALKLVVDRRQNSGLACVEAEHRTPPVSCGPLAGRLVIRANGAATSLRLGHTGSMLGENATLVRRLFAAFNDRDADVVLGLWAPGGVWRPALIGGGLVEGTVYRGHDGIRAFLEVQDETWKSIVAHPLSIREHGDHVLVEVTLDAVGRASGTPVEQTTWNVFHVRDGKVAAGRVYLTEAEALEAAARPE